MIRRSAILAAAAVLFVFPAFADGKKDCTTEPKANWKPVAEAEAAAKAAGYDVRKSKTEGACYEVYGFKGGKGMELFYNPIDLKLMHTLAK
jgi:hypothetical protein